MHPEELKKMRLDKRLSQAEVAAKMGVSQGYYSQVETGNRPREVPVATKVVAKMRARSDRTAGGDAKVGRKRGKAMVGAGG